MLHKMVSFLSAFLTCVHTYTEMLCTLFRWQSAERGHHELKWSDRSVIDIWEHLGLQEMSEGECSHDPKEWEDCDEMSQPSVGSGESSCESDSEPKAYLSQSPINVTEALWRRSRKLQLN